jgi:hypothetical protein
MTEQAVEILCCEVCGAELERVSCPSKREMRRILFGEDFPEGSTETLEQVEAIVSDGDEPPVDDLVLLDELIKQAEEEH